MTDLKDDLAALRIEREPEKPVTRRWIGWVVLLAFLAGGGVTLWKWVTRPRPVEVQTAVVTERAAGTQAAVLNASGYVTARRRATISSKITGKVVEVNVEEGMAVKQGQVLARLDDATAKATLALASAQAESARKSVTENEVQLAQARRTQARLNELVKQRVASQAELDQADADVDAFVARINALNEQIRVADRQVELQRAELDNTVIRAPFAGVAISKDAQPGEMVSPVSAGGGFTRTGICTIVDMTSLEIEVDVNENYINRVRAGQKVTAVLDAYPDWRIPAHVITMVPAADRQKATVLVRIAFEQLDPKILPDMGVKVTLLREEAEAESTTAMRAATLVPKAAVQTDSSGNVVFVLTGELVERRAVRVGGTDGDRVEVLGAVRQGDRVVLSPPEGLASGSKVVVK